MSIFCNNEWCTDSITGKKKQLICADTCNNCNHGEYITEFLNDQNVGATCTRKEIIGLNCEFLCEKNENGIPFCSCPIGFEFDTEENQCKDIDECAENRCALKTPFTHCQNQHGRDPSLEPVCLLQLHGNNREKYIENFDENTYPWNVHIAIRQERKEESYFLPFETESQINECGGAFITEDTVLTAAKCVYEISLKNIIIIAGAYKKQWIDDENFYLTGKSSKQQSQKYTVDNVKIHEKYDEKNGFNDVAILKVSKSNKESSSFEPKSICIRHPEKIDKEVETRCRVVEFGDFGEKLGKNDVLKVTSTPIVANDKCYQQALTYETICTKWGIDENDSCDADLGSPLICPYEEEKNDKCQWLLMGIKKKDHKCDENPRVKDSFAMFTDVAFHYDWITQNISPCSINYGTSTCKAIKIGNTIFVKDLQNSQKPRNAHIESQYTSIKKDKSLFVLKSDDKNNNKVWAFVMDGVIQPSYGLDDPNIYLMLETSLDCPLDVNASYDYGCEKNKHLLTQKIECATQAEIDYANGTSNIDDLKREQEKRDTRKKLLFFYFLQQQQLTKSKNSLTENIFKTKEEQEEI